MTDTRDGIRDDCPIWCTTDHDDTGNDDMHCGDTATAPTLGIPTMRNEDRKPGTAIAFISQVATYPPVVGIAASGADPRTGYGTDMHPEFTPEAAAQFANDLARLARLAAGN